MSPGIPSETRSLARIRYALRKFLSAGDDGARALGLTPQQHQLLLGVAGFNGKGWASIGELAEFLQVRHHSAVGLVDRVAALGLVERRPNPENRREVEVHLTATGTQAVRALHAHHRRDLHALRRMLNVYVLEQEGNVVLRDKTRRGAKSERG